MLYIKKRFFLLISRIIDLFNEHNKFFFILNLYHKKQKLYSVYNYQSINDYKKTQINTTKKKIASGISYYSEKDISSISKFIIKKNKNKKILGICHGVRDGREIESFEKKIKNSTIFGTDLFTNSNNKKIFKHDFNNKLFNWDNKFDFVYSNCIDHSYAPKKAIKNWITSLKKGGLLILDHSISHGLAKKTKIDICAIETELFPFLLLDWFKNKINIQLLIQSKRLKKLNKRNQIIICQKVN